MYTMEQIQDKHRKGRRGPGSSEIKKKNEMKMKNFLSISLLLHDRRVQVYKPFDFIFTDFNFCTNLSISAQRQHSSIKGKLMHIFQLLSLLFRFVYCSTYFLKYVPISVDFQTYFIAPLTFKLVSLFHCYSDLHLCYVCVQTCHFVIMFRFDKNKAL